MSDELLAALTKRRDEVTAQYEAMTWRERNGNADLINRFGLAFYEEISTRRVVDGEEPFEHIISTFFNDLYGRSPVAKRESMAHGRALRRLEAAGKIKLYVTNPGSKRLRWAVILDEPSTETDLASPTSQDSQVLEK